MFNIRHVSSAILVLAAATFATCFGQTATASFKTVTSATTSPGASFLYAVDVNNDGILDLVQDDSSEFFVSLAKGDGTFTSGYSFQFPSPPQGIVPMASGDFNGDGKVDLAFELSGTNQIAVFLGKGDGTFQAPKYVTIALPSSQHFGGAPLVAADFSGDGKVDLVTEGNTNTEEALYLMKGDGTGNFGAPALLYTPPANEGIYSIGAGDFDGDGKADIAFTETYDCTQGGCAQLVHVLYNNGNSSFTDTTNSYPYPQGLNFSTGDLNSDGRTDIFGVNLDNNSLSVLYGQADRTFQTYDTPIATAGVQNVAMADFNGDGRMDLVGHGDTQLVFFLANASPGNFTQQTYAVPDPLSSASYLDIVVGDFNNDTKPDVAFVGGPAPSDQTIVDALNTTANGNWGGCAYPSTGMGIRVCAPNSSAASPVTFNASANAFGQLRMMELWVDGKKVTDQYHTWGSKAWFDFSDTLAAGSHRGVMFAGDIDNLLQKSVFYFTVGSTGGCSEPASPGVNTCMPAGGSTVDSPVQVEASGTVTGTISHMELWVDGVKKDSAAGAVLNTSISLAAGSHRFAVLAINTAGQKWENAVDATVGGGGACSAPTSPGVNICMPASGSTVSSPVQMQASAMVTGTISNMQLWVDGVKKYSVASSMLNTSISLAAGTHRFAVLALNTAGQKWENAVYATVK